MSNLTKTCLKQPVEIDVDAASSSWMHKGLVTHIWFLLWFYNNSDYIDIIATNSQIIHTFFFNFTKNVQINVSFKIDCVHKDIH